MATRNDLRCRVLRNRTSHTDSTAGLAVDAVESTFDASGSTGFDEKSVGVDSEACRHGGAGETGGVGRVQVAAGRIVTKAAL